MQTLSVKKPEFSQKKTNIMQILMIKGFKGEPTRLKCLNIDNLFATVVGNSGNSQMRVKVKYVYQYNEEAYQKLRKAFDSNDSEALEQEWQKAEPIALS